MSFSTQAIEPFEENGLATAAKRPRSLQETGLKEELLLSLLLKQILKMGPTDLADLVREIALPGGVLEPLIQYLRREAQLEVRSSIDGGVRYGLTERGRTAALDAMMRDGYAGPAPVPLEAYLGIVGSQSSSRQQITAEQLRSKFSDVVIEPHILDRLGPALHSGRSMMVYGSPGSGKSFISRCLGRVLDDPVLVPYAVQAGGITVRVFDPEYHRPRLEANAGGARIDSGYDPRYRLCDRPVVSAGGELTLEMLELHYDSASREYRAPLQMRANNGLLIIDDLGRQRVPPEAILNRWIVPMEEGCDYLHSHGGAQFVVPFDVILLFSTNYPPAELADEAFLRRIGYKVRFGELSERAYAAIWQQVCEAEGLEFVPEVARYTIEHLHRLRDVPLLACHPRDLIGLVVDRCRYEGRKPELSPEGVEAAWGDYFVTAESKGMTS
ncbi:AAA family ATPase [Thiohalomonas denitrificans]|uniref:AAA family ATPase n=1 Tax=Thiohalomonas denitrificans TaxID=415747 RepID=UPI0026E9A6F5|nr:AAA family ATPase [Thiohalomonas denitrificans]